MQKLQSMVSTQHGVASAADARMEAHLHFGYKISFKKPEGYLKAKYFQATDHTEGMTWSAQESLLNLLICYQTFHKTPRRDVTLKIQVNDLSMQGKKTIQQTQTTQLTFQSIWAKIRQCLWPLYFTEVT